MYKPHWQCFFFFLSMQYKMSEHCFTNKDIRVPVVKLEKEIFLEGVHGIRLQVTFGVKGESSYSSEITCGFFHSFNIFLVNYLLFLTLKETWKKAFKSVRTRRDANFLFFFFFPVDVAINDISQVLVSLVVIFCLPHPALPSWVTRMPFWQDVQINNNDK